MYAMFYGATAINQPLSSFDTAKVVDVSAFSCGVQLDEKPDSDFRLIPLLPDGYHVPVCCGLQSTTVGIWYFCGYKCECTFVPSPTWWDARSEFRLIPLLSDGFHVQRCDSLQSTTVNIWYFCGNKCEFTFVLGLTWWETGFWSLIPTQSLSDENYVLRCDGLQSGPV